MAELTLHNVPRAHTEKHSEIGTPMEDRRSLLLDLTEADKDWASIVRQCQDYAECCGLLIRTIGAEGKCCTQMGSMMVFPSKYPLSIYNQVLSVQKTYNVLYQKISHDYEFMKETLSCTIASDDFMRRLWNVYETVRQQGCENPILLELIRSDYMYQLTGGKFKLAQIEVNTMASSMGVLSNKVNETHRYLGRVLNNPKLIDSSKFPQSNAVEAMAEGLVKAWQLYDNPLAVVLVIVSANEMNFSDIRNIEYAMLKQNEQVNVLVRTTTGLHNVASLSDNRTLLVDGHEVAVIYFRYYYDPHHFEEKDWTLRLMMEQSKSIKCPSIAGQLAGSKTIQQVLTRPGVLERFLTAEECAQVRDSFVGIYALTQDIIKEATEHPENYVLKPNREGGGNNYYGEDVVPKLKEIVDEKDEDSYILMERVFPVSQYNCKIKLSGAEATCSCLPTVSELGMYGAVIGSPSEILHNTSSGYLLRTKSSSTNEGGYYVGHSSIDTPYLLEDSEMIEELKNSSINPSNCC